MKQTSIAILGAGNMATSLALHLANQGQSVRMYCIEPEVEKQINREHCNDRYLAGIRLPATIRASSLIKDVAQDAHVVIVAVPSFAVPEVLRKAVPHLRKDAIVATISKGLDAKTLEPVVVEEKKYLPRHLRGRLCALGGPAIATEMAKGTTTAFVVASTDAKARKLISDILTSDKVKAAQSSDLKGVGLGSALKNAYAIALGFCDGLQYPTNAKALVVTLAVSEMAGVMLRAGAHPKTAPSLAGLGDLLVTGWSPHGRNRKYGERLVRAHTNDPKRLGMTTVEGIAAANLGLKLSKKLGARTPLLASIHKGINAESRYHQPFVEYLEGLKLGLI